ncbi:transcription-repair coupling factor, partial [Vibrio parahaemolyticus]|nr:transcription-repair coupling factor [Vibrio parahaemolyticus]
TKGTWPAGIEYWQPLFFDHTDTLFEYLPEDSQVITYGDIESAVDTFLTDVEYRYDQKKVDPLRPLLTPEQLWLKKDELFSQLKQLPIAQLSLDKVVKRAGRQNLPVQSLAELGVQQQNKEPLSRLRQFREQVSGKIVFSVESEGRREALTELLQGIKVRPVVHGSLYQALDSGDRFSLILGA